jgi:hypothetical protein
MNCHSRACLLQAGKREFGIKVEYNITKRNLNEN